MAVSICLIILSYCPDVKYDLIYNSRCDEDYDECLSSPCQNGGYCQQTEDPGNYTCACTDEFIGHDCQELKIKTCNEFPCKNGGTCRPGQSKFFQG